MLFAGRKVHDKEDLKELGDVQSGYELRGVL